MTSYTYRDGKMVEVPDTIATEDTEIHEPVKNTLVIRPGVAVVSHAKISGTIGLFVIEEVGAAGASLPG